MAQMSEYSIVTYEREPGHWRAAVCPKILERRGAPGRTVQSTVTPDDSASRVRSQTGGHTTDPETAKRINGRCLIPRPALQWRHAQFPSRFQCSRQSFENGRHSTSERVSASLGARPYLISEGTLDECIQQFMQSARRATSSV